MPLTEHQLEVRDEARLTAPDPERIWLTPKCEGLEIEGRGWCEEHPGDCPDDVCGCKAIEYIRADMMANLKKDFEIARTASHLFERASNDWMERAIKAEKENESLKESLDDTINPRQ